MSRNRQTDEHDVYAASRSSNFVYVMNNNMYTELDAHCDTSDTEPRLPLVVKGQPGSGKSALLANWVQYRREKPEHKHEFLFEYFVDCSSESLQLRRMLHRLVSRLKDHFNLREMEVPTSEERLRWSLIRFIEAAAKKYQNTQSARMVIVLDGVNKLQSPGSPDGTLKWLPTQLPASVRFIVSTVEEERGAPHRSFQELRRRQCPELEIAPLTKEICILIMEKFGQNHYKQLELDRDQQARVMDVSASQQPLFLRALLDSLRIGVFLLDTALEDQLERSLSKESPKELISFLLGQWTAFFDPESAVPGADAREGVLGWVLSLLYVSRHGLSESEIQGAVTLAKYGPDKDPEEGLPRRQMEAINTLLKDMTMEVDGIRRFANDALQDAVKAMYVKTSERQLQLHSLLGRYFAKLEPCDRKLRELPYHLEIAGQWSKLRHSLVKIDMFKWWWTPRHKEEFIKLWASLTKHPSVQADTDGYVTSNLNPADYPVPNARPCYDVVAEYIKSLDDFVGKFGKPEEEVSEVTLRVSDFLLEFATSGFEVSQDAPRFSRPEILTSDLASLGVPFLNLDENGRSCVNVPLQPEAADGKGAGAAEAEEDAAPRNVAASDQMPTCTTYNYRRWMWTQFPLVALANCGERFMKGVLRRREDATILGVTGGPDTTNALPPSLERELAVQEEKTDAPAPPDMSSTHHSVSLGADMMDDSGPTSLVPLEISAIDRTTKLPKLPPAKVSGHHSQLMGRDADRHTAYRLKCQTAQEAVTNDRALLDTLIRQRQVLGQQVDKMRNELAELSAAEAAATDDEHYLGRLNAKHRKLRRQQANNDLLSRNYKCLLLMCQRHPPGSEVLVEDLENQMTQDQLIINAVNQRAATAAREAAVTSQDAAQLAKAINDNSRVQHNILDNLHTQRESLWNEKEQHRVGKSQPSVGGRSKAGKVDASAGRFASGDLEARRERRQRKDAEAAQARLAAQEKELQAVREKMELWDHRCKIINDKTGIADPNVFFEKFMNRDVLAKQMKEMKTAAEARLAELKSAHAEAESDLEMIRYRAFGQQGSSRELRDMDSQMAKCNQRLKRSRERFETTQHLLHDVEAGVLHVGEIVGIQKTKGQHQTTQETLELLEQLLTELLDEEEDGGKAAGGGAGGGKKAAGAGQLSVYDREMEIRARSMIAPHLLKPSGDDARALAEPEEEDAEAAGQLYGADGDDVAAAMAQGAVPSRDQLKNLSRSQVKGAMRGNARRKSLSKGGLLSTS